MRDEGYLIGGVILIKRKKRCRFVIRWFVKDKYKERNERDSKRKITERYR
jgi:hypothetical protein